MWTAALLLAVLQAVQPPPSWLDRPLSSWNKAGASVPQAPRAEEARAAVVARCKVAPLASATARTLTAAGWIAFLPYDQQLVRDDVEILGGMTGADGMCRPTGYNLFVFVGGRFAGMLSPNAMASRLDGSSGVVRMRLPELTTEFERYTSTDPLCCPSARMTVTYRIDRTSSGPLVVPVRVVRTRG